MRLHTNGSTVVLLTPKSRITWRESGRNTSEPVPENPSVTDFDRSGLLCMTPKGERDFSARLAAAGALAADAIDEETVAAVMLGEDSIYLVQGPLNTEGEWPNVIDVGSIEPKRITWPVGVVWQKGDTSLYDMAESHGKGILDTFVPTIECNSHGIAVACSGSGAVVLVRPGKDKIAASFQLPSQDEAAIFACPTERGVLVTLVVDGQDSAYAHIAEDGSLVGHREANEAIPALNLDSGFLIYDGTKKSLMLCDESFSEKTTFSVSWTPLDAAIAPDGDSFALADAAHILRGHVNAKGKLVIVDQYKEVKQAGAKRPGELAAIEAKWDPERAQGRSAVGFAAGMSPSPWTAEAGKPFELVMHARSTGSPGQGICVVIGGDAAKHCSFEAVAVDGVRQPLTADGKGNLTAEFPSIQLVQGISYPFNPKPKNDAQKHAAAMLLEETHLELHVFGQGEKASGDLMSVAISALKSDSPPLKWMRPLTIS
ncbi:MAG: hypothetical protein GY811_31120 [Myxococcales bacterium]|nr:hypothetical protein [Myxococcales bacterium]